LAFKLEYIPVNTFRHLNPSFYNFFLYLPI
jgi:hypothetical protein